jgi:hypothetical protein
VRSGHRAQDRTRPSGEELFEREDLAPESKRVAGQHAHLRQRVEDDADGIVALDRLEHCADGLLQLDFRRMEQRVRVLRILRRRAGELEDIDSVQRPAVRLRGSPKLVRGFGERDVEAAFPDGAAGKQKLYGQRGLSASRLAVNKMEAIGRKTTTQNRVESRNAGGHPAGCS